MRSDEKEATSPASRFLQWTVAAIAVAMSLYHMYVAAFGPPEALVFRGYCNESMTACSASASCSHHSSAPS